MNMPLSKKELDKDLAESSLEDLVEMQKKLESFVEKRIVSKKKEALKEIQNIVKQYELTYEEVTSSIRTAAKRGKAPPLYRHPENWRKTWSGIGEAPDWYKNHPNPEELRINDD